MREKGIFDIQNLAEQLNGPLGAVPCICVKKEEKHYLAFLLSHHSTAWEQRNCWSVWKKTGATGGEPVIGRGDTPEEAIDALYTDIVNTLQQDAEEKSKTAAAAAQHLQRVLSITGQV